MNAAAETRGADLPDDATLVARIAAGEINAFEPLMRRFAGSTPTWFGWKTNVSTRVPGIGIVSGIVGGFTRVYSDAKSPPTV